MFQQLWKDNVAFYLDFILLLLLIIIIIIYLLLNITNDYLTDSK